MGEVKFFRDVDREIYPILFTEQAGYKDTYGGMSGMVFLEAQRVKPRDHQSDTVIVFSHPVGGGAYLPIVQALAHCGAHVIYVNSRYRGNDSALIMEKVVIDLGQAIKHAKEQLGYKTVILAGWSGGGSLSLYYQQQALKTTVTCTPNGDGPDLTQEVLHPADAMLLMAAHPSRHRVLTDSIDPSIEDENDPYTRNPEWNLYDPNGPKAPFSADFVSEFRQKQIDRNRRITGWVKDQLAELKASGQDNAERGFIVAGTMADPRWLDPTLDPNDRIPGVSFLGVPEVVNDGPIGLARFCTLRSWLSQWSVDDARADGIKCAQDVGVPTLVIYNGADEICTPGYAQELFDGVGHSDKQMVEIAGANHYYLGMEQIEKVRESASTCVSWLADRNLI